MKQSVPKNSTIPLGTANSGPTRMEEKGLQIIQPSQPFGIVLQIPLALLFADLSRHPCGKRRQQGETGVRQDPVMDGPKNVVNVAINAVGRVQGARGTRGQAQHGVFALEVPGFVFASGGVGETSAQHAFDPSLEHGGHGEPPHRKLEDHQVCTFDFDLFKLDIPGNGVASESRAIPTAWIARCKCGN